MPKTLCALSRELPPLSNRDPSAIETALIFHRSLTLGLQPRTLSRPSTTLDGTNSWQTTTRESSVNVLHHNSTGSIQQTRKQATYLTQQISPGSLLSSPPGPVPLFWLNPNWPNLN